MGTLSSNIIASSANKVSAKGVYTRTALRVEQKECGILGVRANIDQVHRPLSIGVAEVASRGGHDIRNRNTAPQPVTEELTGRSHRGRKAIGVRDEVGKSIGRLNATSTIQSGVARVGELPIVPDLVNPGMVQEEQRVIGGPLWSRVACRRSSTAGANASHVTSKDKMDARVNAKGRIGVSLHSGVISDVAVHHRVHICLSQSGIDHESQIGRRSIRSISPRSGGIWVGEREEREVPPDVVGTGINPDQVAETTVVDLEIIRGVTPATDTINRSIKEGGILEVSRIQGPIPVRHHPSVTALANEAVLKVLNELPVPWEEQSGEMDLGIEVHMRIDKIIIVEAGWVDRRDERDVRCNERRQVRIVGSSVTKTPDGPNPLSPFIERDGPPFTADPGIPALSGSRRKKERKKDDTKDSKE